MVFLESRIMTEPRIQLLIVIAAVLLGGMVQIAESAAPGKHESVPNRRGVEEWAENQISAQVNALLDERAEARGLSRRFSARERVIGRSASAVILCYLAYDLPAEWAFSRQVLDSLGRSRRLRTPSGKTVMDCLLCIGFHLDYGQRCFPKETREGISYNDIQDFMNRIPVLFISRGHNRGDVHTKATVIYLSQVREDAGLPLAFGLICERYAAVPDAQTRQCRWIREDTKGVMLSAFGISILGNSGDTTKKRGRV